LRFSHQKLWLPKLPLLLLLWAVLVLRLLLSPIRTHTYNFACRDASSNMISSLPPPIAKTRTSR